MRIRPFLFITALIACHPIVWPQTLTKQFPPTVAEIQADSGARPAENRTEIRGSEPDSPEENSYPIAEVAPPPPTGQPLKFEYDHLEKHGDIFTLTGHVVIYYKDYVLRADKAVFNRKTSDATAQGNVELTGGPDDEIIHADHGNMNLNRDTGHFYGVLGTIGARSTGPNKRKLLYTTTNPFQFSGREVIKEGPMQYQVIGGTITSCSLPRPDWRIAGAQFAVNNGKATGKNAFFQLLDIPILFLPYVSHPVNTDSRQSGLLIPIVGNSSTKGVVLGESVYWAINRSADAILGTQYFSKRGWSPSGEFRYRGTGEDFANFHFTALFDRGAPVTNLNQGGQDINFSVRRDFDPEGNTRIVGTGEYLSSYVYRQAFADSFASAVASEVISSIYATHNHHGLIESVDFDRYQNFQGITLTGSTYYTPQIRILHLPAVEVDALDRPLEDTPATWGFSGSFTGLSRSEPGFSSGNMGRLDLYPHISFPFHLANWNFRPEIAVRDTFYTNSQTPTTSTPLENNASVNRKDVEASFEIHPPAVVRDFTAPWLEKLFGGEVRHAIEPYVQYKYVAGVNNFSSIPRFDATDVVSDSNELDYSLTQRLFVRSQKSKPCANAPFPPPLNGIIYVPPSSRECGGDTDAWITWKLAGKYFFDPSFGGAVTPLRRNVLDTTLDLTGVAFLGEARNYSPLVSQLRLRTSQRMNIEWDADYDSKAGRLNASNTFFNYRLDNGFVSLGYSTLQALNPTFTSNPGSQVTKYNLLRMLGGFGSPSKRGLSVAADAGYDFTEDALQYYGIQATYNWDCCGLTFGYRRLSLGSVRNESQPMFSFTLAGVGSAGNLKHSEELY
jgi:LPS-assembly protein